MKFISPFKLSDIARMIGAKSIGDVNALVAGINEIHRVEKGDLTYVDHKKYYAKALSSPASVILIDKEVDCPAGKSLLISENPFRDYNFLAQKFTPFVALKKNVSDTAEIGEDTVIQPGAVIGHQVKIGRNCIIHSNVVIYDRCELGNNVVIHSNSAIGSDAFYFKKENGQYTKMHSCGRVIIHDDVEIGAGCTIDRGVSSDTIIGKGTKFDNQVHIGHDTVIGKNCLFAAQVGVAGVVTIEDNVTLWGQVGINKDLFLAKGSTVYAQSGLVLNTEENKNYFGSPASEAMSKFRELALLKRLPELFKKD